MKNDTFTRLKRTAAEVYQKRTEALAAMKLVPEAKRDEGYTYRKTWMVESVQGFNRSPGERSVDFKTGKYEGMKDEGMIHAMHDLVTRRDPGYIIPAMSCLKREETKK